MSRAERAAAARELVNAVDVFRTLGTRATPEDVYRLALAHARFTGRQLRTVGNTRGRLRAAR